MNEALQMLQTDLMLTQAANAPTLDEIRIASQAVVVAAGKDEVANQELRERIEQAHDLEDLSEDERDAMVDGLPFNVPHHKNFTQTCSTNVGLREHLKGLEFTIYWYRY